MAKMSDELATAADLSVFFFEIRGLGFRILGFLESKCTGCIGVWRVGLRISGLRGLGLAM